MRAPSNLPPGVTDRDIEDAQGDDSDELLDFDGKPLPSSNDYDRKMTTADCCTVCPDQGVCVTQGYCAEPWAHPPCPQCGSTDTERYHHPGSFSIPECWYWECHSCEHSWGHE